MPNKPEDFPVFTELNIQQIQQGMAKIGNYLKDFGDKYKIDNIDINHKVIATIINRIEKRRVYFHIFHNIKMGEQNEGSLMCFWIIKLMPFFNKNTPTNELNAKMVLYLFYRMLFYVAKKRGKKVNQERSLSIDIYYSFRFRDLSKEAIMALAESMIY